MRIGEIAESPHAVKAKDVHESKPKNKIMIVLYSSKTHGRESSPQQIQIIGKSYVEVWDGSFKLNYYTRRKNKGSFCPVEWARRYIQLRGPIYDDTEQLFIFRDRSNVQPHHIRTVLREVLKSFDLDPSLYDTHSFRIGRATDLFKAKTCVEDIKQLGRWKSNAVYRYLRP